MGVRPRLSSSSFVNHVLFNIIITLDNIFTKLQYLIHKYHFYLSTPSQAISYVLCVKLFIDCNTEGKFDQ